MKRIAITGVNTLVAMLLMFSSAPIFAEGGTSGTGSTSGSGEFKTTTSTSTNPINTEDRTKAAAAEAAKEKLAEAKAKAETEHEKACTNRKTAVTNIESRIAARGQNQIDTFTKIADRTETFYTSKGYSLSNYDALVSDVNAKKAAAQATVNTVRADASTVGSVTCTNGDGKVKVESFKKDLRAEQSALKAYKTAVKNLIVGVKSAKSTTTGGTQ